MTPARRRDGWIALLIFVLATLSTAWGSRAQGFTRDEGYYFDAAELYWGWYGEIGDSIAAGKPFRAFSRSSVDRWFGYNHEHPALMKTLYGISWRILHKCECPSQGGRHPVAYAKKHRTLGLMSEAAALRFPAHLFAGLLAALVYLFGARAFSRTAGLVAAVLAIAAPRYFFDAQLAAFDAPVATTWVMCVYAYWRALSEPRWGWRAGVAFGLALATKHNAFFLPFVLLLHYLWVRRDLFTERRVPSIPAVFLWMAALGPVIEFVHWPWMWFDTISRFREYLNFHLHHVYYNMEYLGRNYNKPPFPISYAFVMTLFTVPVTTLVLATGGALSLVREGWRTRRLPRVIDAHPDDRPTWKRPAQGRSSHPGLLIGLNALFPLGIIAFTGAPIFGATKHWHAAIPFLALLAGYAADRLVKGINETMKWRGRRATLAAAGAVILASAPAIADTIRSHPYGLTHYNALAGGPAGGADLGMNRQFWGYSTRGILPWLDEHARPSAPVYWHDTNQPILNMNVREKLMRGDIGNTGLEEPGVKASDIAMVIHEKHFNKYEYWIWDFYGTTRPSLVLADEGVPMVTVYERPQGMGK